MNKYKTLREKIRNAFVGFQIDEEFEECLYIYSDKTDNKVLKNRVFGIDSFPKQMGVKSPHGVLDTVFDFKDIDFNYYAINSLLKLTLRERSSLAIYIW